MTCAYVTLSWVLVMLGAKDTRMSLFLYFWVPNLDLIYPGAWQHSS